MIKVKDKKMCCGCSACMNICPKKAITMVEDEYGFKYPFINEDLCVNCGLCEKVCPILKGVELKNAPRAYAAINKNENVRLNSSSGGIFYLLAKNIIEKNGVVFGAAFSDDFKTVNHIMIDNLKDIDKLMTSKYLQSNINNTFLECKKCLENDKYVLFTGTPCQIEGLLSFLKKDYEKLYTQDFICHGVPSPGIWKQYLEKKQEEFSEKICYVNFRSKIPDWESFGLQIKSENNDYIASHSNDIYMKAFLWDLILRDSCYECQFKKMNRLSDITLGDFWGVNNIDKSMNDRKGTSLIITNSLKGDRLLNLINEECILKEVSFDDSIKYNSAYFSSAKKNRKKIYFDKNINRSNFENLVLKCTKISFFQNNIVTLKKFLKIILRRK